MFRSSFGWGGQKMHVSTPDGRDGHLRSAEAAASAALASPCSSVHLAPVLIARDHFTKAAVSLSLLRPLLPSRLEFEALSAEEEAFLQSAVVDNLPHSPKRAPFKKPFQCGGGGDGGGGGGGDQSRFRCQRRRRHHHEQQTRHHWVQKDRHARSLGCGGRERTNQTVCSAGGNGDGVGGGSLGVVDI